MAELKSVSSFEEAVRAEKESYPGDMIFCRLPNGRFYARVVPVPFDGSTRQQRRAMDRAERKARQK